MNTYLTLASHGLSALLCIRRGYRWKSLQSFSRIRQLFRVTNIFSPVTSANAQSVACKVRGAHESDTSCRGIERHSHCLITQLPHFLLLSN